MANPQESGNGHETTDYPHEPDKPAGRLRVWRASIRRHRTANRLYRVLVALLGGAVAVGGLALIPLPGPGWMIVFLGLAILATEFSWAARLERFARNRVAAWTRRLGAQSIPVRGAIGGLSVLLVLALVYGLFWLTGVPGWVPDSWLSRVPGLEN
jgi:uncharacterized protein (TIGR02611 family)